MLHKYRKKMTIEAEQFDESDEMMKKWWIHDVKSDGVDVNDPRLVSRYWYTNSYSSVRHPIHVGDWIVGDPPFPDHVIADDIFKKTYERCD